MGNAVVYVYLDSCTGVVMFKKRSEGCMYEVFRALLSPRLCLDQSSCTLCLERWRYQVLQL